MMQRLNIKTLAFLLVSAALIPSFSFAAFSAAEKVKLEKYASAVSSGNPKAASDFLADTLFVEKLKTEKPLVASALISKAEAVRDLEKLLDRRWYSRQESELSKALEIRVDKRKPLSSVGIGPEPEKLLLWVDKYKKRRYSKAKKALIERAIRKFEVVFGTGAAAGKSQWEKLTLRERNVFLADKAHKVLEQLINAPANTDEAFIKRVKDARVLKYLSPSDRGRFRRYMDQLRTSALVQNKLSPDKINKIKGLPIEQQLYMLGRMFDNSEIKGSKPSMEGKVDALRQSRPAENLSYQQRRLLSSMLQTALVAEVSDTAMGSRIAKFYRTHPLKIAVENCANCYAKFEPEGKRIVIDADLVQQYLRVNNISSRELFKSREKMSGLVKLISPIFIHESTHYMQHAWADSMGIYKPYSQEDEVEANSSEAVFTLEKMKKDAAFAGTMRKMRSLMPYADKRIKMAARYRKNPDKFGEYVKRVYYYGLPSFAQRKAEILSAIDGEMERRAALGEKEKKAEVRDVDLAGAIKMTPEDFIAGIRYIGDSALLKVKNDLLNDAAYRTHYEQAREWNEMVFSSIASAPVSGSGKSLASKVPALR